MKPTSATAVAAFRQRYFLRARSNDGRIPIEPIGCPGWKYVFCVLKADMAAGGVSDGRFGNSVVAARRATAAREPEQQAHTHAASRPEREHEHSGEARPLVHLQSIGSPLKPTSAQGSTAAIHDLASGSAPSWIARRALTASQHPSQPIDAHLVVSRRSTDALRRVRAGKGGRAAQLALLDFRPLRPASDPRRSESAALLSSLSP